MAGEKTRRLLQRVAVRHWMERFLGRFFLLALILAGAYATLLCAARLLGLLPDSHFTYGSLAAPFGLGLLAAAALTWPAKPDRIARLVDVRANTKDLYLTAVLIEHSFGDYKPLVLQQAESRAAAIRPRQVVPLRVTRRLLCLLLAAGVLGAGVRYLPRLDPFGHGEARQREAQRRKQLEESRKAVALRTELLKKQDSEAALSKEVSEKLDQLKATLQQAKPDQPKANLAGIQQGKKALAEEYRRTQERRLKDALDRRPVAQEFGQMSAQAGEWKEQLQKGNVEGIRNELTALTELAQKLQAMPEGLDKEKVRQEMKERLQEMANFMAKQANNAPMNAALNRALEQIALAQAKGLNKEAMEALKENLKLTDMEAQALAQNMRDLAALEEGLKAAQLAQQLNGKGGLNGEDLKDAADYAALYAALMAKLGQQPGEGIGGGMGGPGIGEGGVAPEDETQTTAFKPEQANDKMVPGKILLQWKTQELPEPGKARELYMAGLQQARQDASEALVKEEVPPGYHEAISKYFDTLGENIEKPAP